MAAAIKSHPNTVLGMMGYRSTEDFIDLTLEDMANLRKDARRYSINTVFDPQLSSSTTRKSPSLHLLRAPLRNSLSRTLPGKAFIFPSNSSGNEAQFVGSFNAIPDPDGPIRSMPLVFKYDDFFMPSLSAQAAALYNESAVEPVLLQTAGFTESDHLQGVNLGGFETVPTDREGRMLIRYYTTPRVFSTYSIASFLDGSVDPSLYEGKVVLVGMTALGLYDNRPNPFSPATPGVYTHAMVVQNILDEVFCSAPLYGSLEVLAYILIGVF